MKKVGKISLVMLFLFALTGCDRIPVSAVPQPATPAIAASLSPPYDRLIEGEPDLITVKGGYYVWKTGNSWHIRTARTAGPHLEYPRDIFVGNVHVEEAAILDVRGVNVTPPDIAWKGAGFVSFRFEGKGEVKKGLDFRVSPITANYCVTLDLRLNDLDSYEYVHLGKTVLVPDTMPTRICFNP